MQDPKVAPPVDDARGHVESPTARSPKPAAIGRLVGSRPVRWAFVLGAVALAGYALARHWKQITTALGHLGFLSVASDIVVPGRDVDVLDAHWGYAGPIRTADAL